MFREWLLSEAAADTRRLKDLGSGRLESANPAHPDRRGDRNRSSFAAVRSGRYWHWADIAMTVENVGFW